MDSAWLRTNWMTFGSQMLAYPWFDKKDWKRELDHMMKSGVKLEIEALSKKGISFITDEYISKKLRDKDYLQ